VPPPNDYGAAIRRGDARRPPLVPSSSPVWDAARTGRGTPHAPKRVAASTRSIAHDVHPCIFATRTFAASRSSTASCAAHASERTRLLGGSICIIDRLDNRSVRAVIQLVNACHLRTPAVSSIRTAPEGNRSSFGYNATTLDRPLNLRHEYYGSDSTTFSNVYVFPHYPWKGEAAGHTSTLGTTDPAVTTLHGPFKVPKHAASCSTDDER